MIFTRSAINLALIAADINERQVRQAEFAGDDGFDLTSMPYKQSKVYPQRRDPATLDLCVVHVSDVTGGAGVSKRRVQHWESVLRRRGTAAFLGADILGYLQDHHGVLYDDEPEYLAAARRIALWERMRNWPYHRIGAANGDNLRNHPLSFRTKHGNAGNDGAGWALDIGHDEDLQQWHIETGRASLTSLLCDMHEAGSKHVRVAPHRCFSAGRRNDPGRRVWLGVVKPVVEVLPWVSIDYELSVGSGRPVPRSWDPEALFDDRGRRLDDHSEVA